MSSPWCSAYQYITIYLAHFLWGGYLEKQGEWSQIAVNNDTQSEDNQRSIAHLS